MTALAASARRHGRRAYGGGDLVVGDPLAVGASRPRRRRAREADAA